MAIVNCTFLFVVLLTSFVSPISGLHHLKILGAHIVWNEEGSSQNLSLKALLFARVRGDRSGTRRLGDHSDTTLQDVTLTISGAGGEDQGCTDCFLAIYDTSSCDEQAIAEASPYYNETQYEDNPWDNPRYTIDATEATDYEDTFNHGLTFTDYLGKAIVLSGSDGNPVACGIFGLLNENGLLGF